MLIHPISRSLLIASVYLGLQGGASVVRADQVTLPHFGIAFEVPSNWSRLPEVNYSQLARFAQTRENKVIGLIEIDVSPAKGRTPGDLANKLAADRNGEVIGERKIAAGVATEIRLAPSGGMGGFVVAILPVRDQFVLISCGAADEATALTMLRTLAASVNLSDPKPADEQLSLRKMSEALFKSPLRLSLPEPYRADKVKHAETEAFYGVRNWVNSRDEASLQMQVIPNPNHIELKDLVDTAQEQLQKKLNLADPLTFEAVRQSPTVYLSSVFATKEGEAQRIAYLALDDDRFLTLIFRTTAADPAARDRYSAAADSICHSAFRADP